MVEQIFIIKCQWNNSLLQQKEIILATFCKLFLNAKKDALSEGVTCRAKLNRSKKL